MAEKSVAWELARALSAGNLREQTSFENVRTISVRTFCEQARGSEQQELLWIFAQLELIFVVENAD